MPDLNTKFVFFGTSDFAVTVLENLLENGFRPALVITESDKPKGRGLATTPTPIKIWSTGKGIPCISPQKLKDDTFLSELKESKATFAIVAEYGRILPKVLLDLYPNKFLNVHPSLLPKYRGPSPIQTAILNDEKENGVTIIVLDAEVDHGPVVGSALVEADISKLSYKEFATMLGIAGGNLLARLVAEYISGKIKPINQNHSEASFTKKISKEDSEIDLMGDARRNWLKIKAYENGPGTYFMFDSKKGKLRVKIKKASYENGLLVIDSVIPENKKEMSYEDFKRGHKKLLS